MLEILTVCSEKDELVIKLYFRMGQGYGICYKEAWGGRRGQYIRNTVFLPLKYENIPRYFGLLVFQYKVYNIYYVFLIFGYLKENVS